MEKEVLLLGELLYEARLSDGVLNIVQANPMTDEIFGPVQCVVHAVEK